jgi:hypothetical protein
MATIQQFILAAATGYFGMFLLTACLVAVFKLVPRIKRVILTALHAARRKPLLALTNRLDEDATKGNYCVPPFDIVVHDARPSAAIVPNTSRDSMPINKVVGLIDIAVHTGLPMSATETNTKPKTGIWFSYFRKRDAKSPEQDPKLMWLEDVNLSKKKQAMVERKAKGADLKKAANKQWRRSNAAWIKLDYAQSQHRLVLEKRRYEKNVGTAKRRLACLLREWAAKIDSFSQVYNELCDNFDEATKRLHHHMRHIDDLVHLDTIPEDSVLEFENVL